MKSALRRWVSAGVEHKETEASPAALGSFPSQLGFGTDPHLGTGQLCTPPPTARLIHTWPAVLQLDTLKVLPTFYFVFSEVFLCPPSQLPCTNEVFQSVVLLTADPRWALSTPTLETPGGSCSWNVAGKDSATRENWLWHIQDDTENVWRE